MTVEKMLDLPDDTPMNAEMTAVMAEALEGSRCSLAFEVEVEKSDFYSVAVGHRGDTTYSRADLEAADWSVQLSLGG